VTLVAQPGATTSVEVGDVTYTGAQIGTLSGEVRAKKVAPPLTIGYGSDVGSGFSFGIDAGAMFQGPPRVRSLIASGPIETNTAFTTQLANERAEIEDDIDNYKVYPTPADRPRLPLLSGAKRHEGGAGPWDLAPPFVCTGPADQRG
jgi:hypothetical protein